MKDSLTVGRGLLSTQPPPAMLLPSTPLVDDSANNDESGPLKATGVGAVESSHASDKVEETNAKEAEKEEEKDLSVTYSAESISIRAASDLRLPILPALTPVRTVSVCCF